MTTISHIQGDTFSRKPRWLDGENKMPVDLSGNTFTGLIKSVGGEFEADLTCDVLDQTVNKGSFIIAAQTDTWDWPVGALILKVTRDNAGVKTSLLMSVVVRAG